MSFLLSMLSGVRTESGTSLLRQEQDRHYAEMPSAGQEAERNLNRDICITAAHGYTFAGNESTNSLSARVTQSGKRSSSQIRSTFRIVKDGKIIDNNHNHPFLAQSVIHRAGVYLSERYLFSICRLRL